MEMTTQQQEQQKQKAIEARKKEIELEFQRSSKREALHTAKHINQDGNKATLLSDADEIYQWLIK